MRRTRSAWTVIGLALVAGCIDMASPGGARRVALTVVPSYALSGPHDGTPSDVDSFVVRVSNQPFPDTTIAVRIPVGEDTIRISIPVTVSAGEDTVDIAFDGYSSATGLRLYSGTARVVLLAGLASAPAPVQVNYVGPGQNVAALVITPRAAGLQPGNTQPFTYAAFDSSEAPMPDDSVPVTFVSRDPAVVIVGAGGLAQAVAVGETWVVVRSVARSSVRDSARVTVAAAAPPLIGVTPASVTFSDTVGTGNPADKTVDVENVGGGTLGGLAVGTITYTGGATGWLTATLNGSGAPAILTLHVSNAGLSAGTFTATVPVTSGSAGNSPQSVSVTLNMTAAALASISVDQGFAVLRPGNTQALTVTGRNAGGAVVPVTGLTFTSRAPLVATVDAAGIVTAVGGGTAVVVAQAAGFSDSMMVAVGADGSAVVSAVSNGRAFNVVRTGDTVRVRVAVDLRGVAPEKLGSYNATFTWATAQLGFVRAEEVPGAENWSGATINCPAGFTSGGCSVFSNSPAGTVRFGGADPAGRAGPTVALLDITLVATGAGSSALTLSLEDLSAPSPTYTVLRTNALIVPGVTVRVQ